MIGLAVLQVFLVVFVLLQERGAQLITIRFVGGNDLISRGIRLVEYGFWATHVETLMPDGTLLGAHASGGVQARPKDYDKGKFSKELFLPIPATPQQTDAFHTFLRTQIGKPYDFEAIVGIVAQRDWQNDNMDVQRASRCRALPGQRGNFSAASRHRVQSCDPT